MFCPRHSFPERHAVLGWRHGRGARGARTKGRISPDLCKPKSSNTQLDECLVCQQLQRRGVDLAVTCTDALSALSEGLFAYYLQVRALHTLAWPFLTTLTSSACLHQVLVVFTKGSATHLSSLPANPSQASALQCEVNVA